MNTYEKMINDSQEVQVIEKYFKSKAKGLCKNNKIGISKRLKRHNEKVCILAEELGHYHTTVGDITDQSKIDNRRQEHRARRWAVKKLIRVEQFIDAFNNGVRNRSELAEFLEVTEEFIEMSLEHFKAIYGLTHSIDKYTICFNPLIVYKHLEE